MLKSIQIKIVLIFMILGMFMIGALGIIFGYELQEINDAAASGENVSELVLDQIEETKIITLVAIRCFCCSFNNCWTCSFKCYYKTNFKTYKKCRIGCKWRTIRN
ncbi:MAG: hypothetical protein IKG42_07050 [Clostridia bacterium]|nr:hypothetical protein [Clostridia bacterium]